MSTTSEPSSPRSPSTKFNVVDEAVRMTSERLWAGTQTDRAPSIARSFLLGHRQFGVPELRSWKLGFYDHVVEDALAMEFGLPEVRKAGIPEGMRGRVTFPLRDPVGRYQGLLGRSIAGSQPIRWLYPPESEIWSKRTHVLALTEYLSTVTMPGMQGLPPILVEGPFDVLRLWSEGHLGISCHGTTITREQALLIRNMNPLELYVCPDSDDDWVPQKPGQTAPGENLLKSIARFKTVLPSTVKKIELPTGDPDSFILEQGRAHFEHLLSEAQEMR